MICTLNQRGVLAEEFEKYGINIIELSRKRLKKLDYSLTSRITSIMKEHNIHILRTYNDTSSFYGRIAGKIAGVPVIIPSFHGRRKVKIRKRIISYLLGTKFSDIIVAVSKSVKEDLIKYDFIPQDKIRIVYDGIVFENYLSMHEDSIERRRIFNLNETDYVVGTTGRIEPSKGHINLIRAFAHTRDICRNSKLLIVGDGSATGELIEEVRRLKIEKDVIFTGFRKDIPQILRMMDIFVFPTYREGFSISLLEAMAAGLPIIASDIMANRELIPDEKYGLLVEPGNINALSSSMTYLYENRQRAINMGKMAQNRITENFTIDKTVKAYNSIFEDLLRQKYYMPF